MRSDQPVPGNPWPHDMVLHIDTAPNALIELLFARELWRFEIREVPSLDAPPALGASSRLAPGRGLGSGEMAALWRQDWERAWSLFDAPNRGATGPDAKTARMLATLDDTELAHAVSGAPSEFWRRGIDVSALGDWERMLTEAEHVPTLESTPERRSLSALIAAWKTGLTHIVQLPYAGYFGERINERTLVVSGTTRFDPALFSRALATPLGNVGR
ncbi:hypothetical protein N1027_12235 [Herbiconiux sp. CPCC 205763]|uniref:Uncharacterized protein n=1 Tax=Herbiconiux aconitum TaxID=2970913 RepID=A0ABT2GRQ8_9MICO|nr:hypothetical protein [Herbiconiux aconitum]MCS5718903.1 hypothetical protein [Herbiconiux aconitum]